MDINLTEDKTKNLYSSQKLNMKQKTIGNKTESKFRFKIQF